MTFSDYLIDITLISIVLVQMRGRKLTAHSLLLPVGIVAYVAITYLKAIPTNGNNLLLIGACAAVGATLGGLAAASPRCTSTATASRWPRRAFGRRPLDSGHRRRLAFQLYASHGGGTGDEDFSVAHSISAATAWTAALILMAISEATVRTAVLAWRGHTVHRQHQLGGRYCRRSRRPRRCRRPRFGHGLGRAFLIDRQPTTARTPTTPTDPDDHPDHPDRRTSIPMRRHPRAAWATRSPAAGRPGL